MIEYIALFVTVLGGFGGIITILYQILQAVKEGYEHVSEQAEENSKKIESLRSDVKIEFAQCRMHRCGGMVSETPEI